MANRTMQQKELKLKRQRRLFPRSYSSDFIPVGRAPNREVLTGFSDRAKAGMPVQFRRGTTDLKEAEARAYKAYMEAMFPSWFGFTNNAPRAATIRKVEDMLKGVPLERNVVLMQTRYVKIMLFFDFTNKSYLVRCDVLADTFQCSVNYGNRERAKQAFLRKSVLWKPPLKMHTKDSPS